MLIQRSMVPAAAGLAIVLALPGAAAADWQVRDTAPGDHAWHFASVALLGGATASVLGIQRGRERRLVVRRPGRPTRTLLTADHNFGASVAADRLGHIAVAFTVIPRGGRFRRSYLWTGGTVRPLTDGTRHATATAAATAGGRLAVAVTEGTDGVTWVRRGSFRSGLGPRRSTNLAVGASGLAVSPAGSTATIAERDAAVGVAAGPTAPFGSPITLPSLPASAGRTALGPRTAVGLTADDDVVAAATASSCTTGTGDRSGACAGPLSSVVQLWQWRAGRSVPVGGPISDRTTVAQQPAVVNSGERTWATWVERAASGASTLLAVRIHNNALGAIRRLRLVGGERVVASQVFLSYAAAPAPGGGLRFYLPVVGRRSGALDTVVLGVNGRFGPRETVVRGPRFAGARTLTVPTPGIGAARDLVAWNIQDHGPRAQYAVPR